VVTTDYTLVLYLSKGEGSTYGNEKKTFFYICFENNGELRTMGKVSIVLDNMHKEQCSTLIWKTMAINSRQ
jgi:hypothetical protein